MSDNDVDITVRARDLTKEAFAAVSKALKELESQTEGHSRKTKSLGDEMAAFFNKPVDMSKLAVGALAGVGAGLVAVAAGVIALGSHGADVADVQAHFQGLNEEIGNNAKTMMTTLADATGHTISNFDLMKAANLAMADGVRLTESQFGLLGKASRVLADQTGGDTKQAFETLLDVMESGKTKALKDIGVTIDQTKAKEDYARSIHKTVGDLNENEVRLASQAAVLKALEGRLKSTGEAQDDFADAVARGRTFFQNFNDDLSVGIANSPVLAAGLGGVQKAMDVAFGGNSQGLIKSIVGLIESAAIHALDFAQVGIATAGVLGRAFALLQVVFAGVMVGITGLVEGALRVSSTMYEFAASMPGASAQTKLMAQAAADAATNVGGMRRSFQEQAKEAAAGVMGNSAYQRTLAGVSAGVQTVRDALVKAQGAKTDDTAATDTNTAALKNHGKSSGEASGQSKAAADAAKKHAEEIKKLGESLSGGSVLKGLADMNEALKAEGLHIRQLPVDALTRVNKAVEDGIAIYRRRGEAAPRALQLEALAIRAALREAQLADEEFAKLHGPITFGPTGGVDLKNIPIAGGGNINSPFAGGVDNTFQLNSRNLSGIAGPINAGGAGNLAGGALDRKSLMESVFGSSKEMGAALSSTILGALQGGGNPVTAAAGMVGSKVGSSIAGSLKADGTTMFTGALGGVMSSALPVIGSLVAPLASAIWGKLFGTAGRDSVKDFAATFKGGFDGPGGLHDTLLKELGSVVGEDFWKDITQKTGRNDKAGAAAVIERAKQALADAAANKPATAEDEIRGAGFVSRAELQRTADTAKRVYEAMRDSGNFTAEAVQAAWARANEAMIAAGDTNAIAAQKTKDALAGIDAEIKTLSDSIAGEAPEEFMGAVETETRRRIDELAAQRKKLEAEQQQAQEDTQDAVSDTADGVDSIRERAQSTLEIFESWRDALREAGEAAGGFSMPGGGGEMPGHSGGAYIRQDHVARVHAGEIIGPADFMTRALVQALQVTGATTGGRSGGRQVIQLVSRGRVLAQSVFEDAPAVLGGYGAVRAR